MPISLSQTQNEVWSIGEQAHDKETKDALHDLSMKLMAAQKAVDANDRGWDLPSMIVGGLFTAAVSLLLFAGDVRADSLDINLTSYHADKSYSYNNENFGLGITKDINHHWQLQGGFYKNSYDKDSVYALVNLKHEMKHWNWGVAFGFVTGYDDIENKSKPMQSKLRNGYKSSSEREHHGREHDERGSKYRVKNAPHSHPKNLNAIQFMILPNVTWKITKKHALNLTVVPAFTKDTFAFAGLKYQYKFGGK